LSYRIVAQQQVVPAQGGIRGSLLQKYPVVINPSMPAMALRLTNQKPGIMLLAKSTVIHKQFFHVNKLA
jgi:hypothetical protein